MHANERSLTYVFCVNVQQVSLFETLAQLAKVMLQHFTLVHLVSKTHWTTRRPVDSELLRYFPGHADAFQILLYGVYPVRSWSSRLSLCTAYIPVYSLSWQSVVVHLQTVPERSRSSLFYDEISKQAFIEVVAKMAE